MVPRDSGPPGLDSQDGLILRSSLGSGGQNVFVAYVTARAFGQWDPSAVIAVLGMTLRRWVNTNELAVFVDCVRASSWAK